jgi:hypothetical protein
MRLTCKRYKKLREYADLRGVKLSRFIYKPVDVELAKEFIDAAEFVLKKFPELRGSEKKPFTLRLSCMPNEDFAIVYKNKPNILNLNSKKVRDKERLVADYTKMESSGWVAKGTDYKSVVYHEMGHMFGFINKIDATKAAMIVGSIMGDFSAEAIVNKLKNDLSDYSTTNGEIISEMFSAFFGSHRNDFVFAFIEKCDKIRETGEVNRHDDI